MTDTPKEDDDIMYLCPQCHQYIWTGTNHDTGRGETPCGGS